MVASISRMHADVIVPANVLRRTCRQRQIVIPSQRNRCGLFCGYMKTTKNKVKQHRSFRRLVRQLLSGLIKHQSCDHQQDIQKVIAMLQDIGESIEIIAREIARQIKGRE